MRKTTALLTALLVSIFALTACNQISEGRIVEKEHHDAYQTVTMMPIVTSNGKTTTTTMMPMFQYYPESWEIKIQGYIDAEKKELNASFYVKETVYNEVNVGDYFKFDEASGTTSRPVEEREATSEEQNQLSND